MKQRLERSMRGLLATAVLAVGMQTAAMAATADIGVGAQYDTTHVYVAPQDVDAFTRSFLATFGGTSTKQVVATVTPTPSETTSQLLQTPVGTVSLFGFKTPIPYPFGSERTGYLVKDLDVAVKAAVKAGADVVVAPFPDPIGRDAVIRWPGGVTMQLYWHTTKPNYAAFETVPDNRVYLSPQQTDAFIKSFLRFSGGHVVSDNAKADGVLIGRPKDSFRDVHLASTFGNIEIFATDGHLPYPYGREMTGYAVQDLQKVLDQAKASGAEILVQPFKADGVQSAMVKFPGGYIAEIHNSSQ